MEHTPAPTAESRAAHATNDNRVINLRRFWRWRAALAGLALASSVVFMGAMTFSGRSAPPPPPKPEVVEAAWQKLVSETIATTAPADEVVALPTSEHARTGLMRVHSAN